MEDATIYGSTPARFLFAQSFFVSGGDDGRVCVWAKGSRELLLCFEEHRGAVLEVAPDVSDLSMLHSVGRDRSIFTFSLKEERRVAAHQLPKATAAGFTSLSQRRLGELELVTGAADGRLLLWDVDVPDRPTEEAPSRATVAVTRVAVSPSGRFLAVGDEKGRLRVHDAQVRSASGEGGEREGQGGDREGRGTEGGRLVLGMWVRCIAPLVRRWSH